MLGQSPHQAQTDLFKKLLFFLYSSPSLLQTSKSIRLGIRNITSPVGSYFFPSMKKVGKKISRCCKISKILASGLPHLKLGPSYGPQTVDGP